eukprot:GILJ01044636.1.p1 GENE.GILJ01044636.1~~GILJ01044636.1.p1  ORF type:complete len:116 (+),score=9.23 GILJ01044636.1:97-444(+)
MSGLPFRKCLLFALLLCVVTSLAQFIPPPPPNFAVDVNLNPLENRLVNDPRSIAEYTQLCPLICPLQPFLVCGIDGVTYLNNCLAICHGVPVQAVGACLVTVVKQQTLHFEQPKF